MAVLHSYVTPLSRFLRLPPLGLRVGSTLVIIRYVFDLPASICFCDKPSPFRPLILLAQKHTLPAIPAIISEDYLCVSPI